MKYTLLSLFLLICYLGGVKSSGASGKTFPLSSLSCIDGPYPCTDIYPPNVTKCTGTLVGVGPCGPYHSCNQFTPLMPKLNMSSPFFDDCRDETSTAKRCRVCACYPIYSKFGPKCERISGTAGLNGALSVFTTLLYSSAFCFGGRILFLLISTGKFKLKSSTLSLILSMGACFVQALWNVLTVMYSFNITVGYADYDSWGSVVLIPLGGAFVIFSLGVVCIGWIEIAKSSSRLRKAKKGLNLGVLQYIIYGVMILYIVGVFAGIFFLSILIGLSGALVALILACMFIYGGRYLRNALASIAGKNSKKKKRNPIEIMLDKVQTVSVRVGAACLLHILGILIYLGGHTLLSPILVTVGVALGHTGASIGMWLIMLYLQDGLLRLAGRSSSNVSTTKTTEVSTMESE